MKRHHLPLDLDSLICEFAWGVSTKAGILRECLHYISYRGKIPGTLLKRYIPTAPSFPVKGGFGNGCRKWGEPYIYTDMLHQNPYILGNPYRPYLSLLRHTELWSDFGRYLLAKIDKDACKAHHMYKGPLQKKLKRCLSRHCGQYAQIGVWNYLYQYVFGHDIFTKESSYLARNAFDKMLIGLFLEELEEAALVSDPWPSCDSLV